MGKPLWKNASFETMKSFVFIVRKKFFFLSKTLLTLTSSLIFSEKKNLKKLHFLTKSMGSPLWKDAIFETLKNFCFYSQKKFPFYSEHD